MRFSRSGVLATPGRRSISPVDRRSQLSDSDPRTQMTFQSSRAAISVIRSTKNPAGFPWSSVYRMGLSSVRATFTSREAAAGQQSAAIRIMTARMQSPLFRYSGFRFFLSAGRIIEGTGSRHLRKREFRSGHSRNRLLSDILPDLIFFWEAGDRSPGSQ